MATATKSTEAKVTEAKVPAVPSQLSKSVFAGARNKSYPYEFHASLQVGTLIGGVPQDPKIAEAWLQTKIAGKDDLIRATIAEIMAEQEVSAAEATEILNDRKNLNGFRRFAPPLNWEGGVDRTGQLYIEGRQLKAALKEAVSVACAAKKVEIRSWGATKKFLTSYLPEHVFVVEERLPLSVNGEPVFEPSGVMQSFIHNFRGSSISYQEYVNDAEIDFTVITDHPFTDEQWALFWTTGEMQGVGASRSQEYGRYAVTRWDRVR